MVLKQTYITCRPCVKSKDPTPRPAVIKLFESENELKCKNRLRDFIERLCLFSNI